MIACLYHPNEHQHIEHELSYILPDHGRSRRTIIHDRRTGRELTEYDAGKNYDRAFKTHSGITLQEADSDALSRLSCKCRKRYWRYCCVHIQSEESSIHREYDDERQDCYEQAPYEGHRP